MARTKQNPRKRRFASVAASCAKLCPDFAGLVDATTDSLFPGRKLKINAYGKLLLQRRWAEVLTSIEAGEGAQEEGEQEEEGAQEEVVGRFLSTIKE